VTDSQRKLGSDMNGNPNYGQETVDFFFIISKKTNKILTVRLEGLFWAVNKVGCSFILGLWKLHIMVVQDEKPWDFMAKDLGFGLSLWKLHTMPGRRLRFLYILLSTFSPYLWTVNKVWPFNLATWTTIYPPYT
jgi:hypothetical protein